MLNISDVKRRKDLKLTFTELADVCLIEDGISGSPLQACTKELGFLHRCELFERQDGDVIISLIIHNALVFDVNCFLLFFEIDSFPSVFLLGCAVLAIIIGVGKSLLTRRRGILFYCK